MTIETAITYIDRISDDDCYTAEAYEAMRMAIGALEKQIPKKPIMLEYEDAHAHYYRCPNECQKFGGYVVVNRYQKHCTNCGQAIDWEE